MRPGMVAMFAVPLTLCSEPAQEPGFQMASSESAPALCVDGPTREKIRSMVLEALDEALKQHIVHTFEVWMKDDRDQPNRARNGVRNGIVAYIHASKGAMAWMPMECPG